MAGPNQFERGSFVASACLGVYMCARSQKQRERLTNRNVVEKGAGEDEDMPDLMTVSEEVEFAWPPLFGKMRGVEDEANHVAAKGGQQLVEKQVCLQTGGFRRWCQSTPELTSMIRARSWREGATGSETCWAHRRESTSGRAGPAQRPQKRQRRRPTH